MFKRKLKKLLALLLCVTFIFQQASFAQVTAQLEVASHLAGLRSAGAPDVLRPLHLRYLSYQASTNKFDLLVDKGSLQDITQPDLEAGTKSLLTYFLVGVTLPNDTFWVNLRPDDPATIIDDALARTDIGRIMLASDVQLKKDVAGYTSPDTAEGRLYWDKLYQKAGELFGSQNITIPTLTRPWIVPDEVLITQTKDGAYIFKATLKVMLEQDYLKNSAVYGMDDARLQALNEYSSQLIRELIIPRITREVNTAPRYGPLRQVYYSLILAQWFKARFTGTTSRYAFSIDRGNLQGLTSPQPWSKDTYFRQYQKSFKDGQYTLQRPETTPSGQVIRSYFSGGIRLAASSPASSAFPGDVVPAAGTQAVPVQYDGTTGTVSQASGFLSSGAGYSAEMDDARSTEIAESIMGPTPQITVAGQAEIGEVFGKGYSGTFMVGERIASPDFIHRQEIQNYQEWVKGIVRSDLANIASTGAISMEISPAMVDEATKRVLRILEYRLKDGRMMRDAMPNQYYSDIVRRILAYLLTGNPHTVFHAYRQINELGEKVALEVLQGIEHEGNMRDQKEWLKLTILAGLIGLDFKSSASAGSIIVNTNVIPLKPGNSIEEKARYVRERLDSMMARPLAIDFWDDFERALTDRSRGRPSIVWFPDDYIEAMFDLKFIEMLLTRNPELVVHMVPRSGRFGNDASFEDIARFMELPLYTQLKQFSAQGRFTVSQKGPCFGNFVKDAASQEVVDLVKNSNAIVVKGARSYEMMHYYEINNGRYSYSGGACVPAFYAYAVCREFSESVTGVDSRAGLPVFIGQEPGVPSFVDFRARGKRQTALFPSNDPGNVARMTVMEYARAVHSAEYRDFRAGKTPAEKLAKILDMTGASQRPASSPPVTEPQSAVPGASAAASTTGEAAKGGIDFRSLPIVSQAISNLSADMPLARLNSMDLDSELQEIEILVRSGIIPSGQRMKEYLQYSCYKGKLMRERGQVISCISAILRQQEEGDSATDPVLRDILVVLETRRTLPELRSVFNGAP